MMLWLLVIILSYFFFSLSFIGDKLVLSGPPNAKLYTFYVGALNILIVFLIPFANFSLPNSSTWGWIFLEALVYIVGIYAMFTALEKFEVSRVMTVIGALQPLMILLLTFAFWGGQTITPLNLLAFVLLFVGSMIISLEKKLKISVSYLFLIFFAALMFSLDYVFSKEVFLQESFLSGLIWMRIISFALVLIFLVDKKLRKQIFAKKGNLNKKTGTIFLFTQTAGGLANLLQSFAISLAPIAYLAIINSLRGIQYVFLFLIALFLSHFFPKVMKEDISKRVIIQKSFAIFLIVGGLVLLVI